MAHIMEEYKYKYEGTIELYHEQGMGSHAIIVHDNRGLHKGPTFNNETKAWDGPERDYKDIHWAVFIRGGELLKVWSPEGVPLFSGILEKDRDAIVKHNYYMSFIPKGVTISDWVTWTTKEYRAEIHTHEPVSKEEVK